LDAWTAEPAARPGPPYKKGRDRSRPFDLTA